MATFTDEKEVRMIEELAIDFERVIEENGTRKDLKEKRGIIKQSLYEGSHKLKHMAPKGKHL